MRPIPCKLVINSSRGYIFAPMEFPSINQAVRYGRTFGCGFAWRVFSREGELIRRGFCDNTPSNGYPGI